MAYLGRNWAFRGPRLMGWVYNREMDEEGSPLSLGGGETAGLVIAMTFALNAWLVFLNRARTKVDLGKRFAKLEKYHIPGLLLLIYIWLTQSRGPMIAVAAGYPVLQIPRFKNTKLGLGLVAVLLVLGALGAQQYFSRYTDVKDLSSVTEEQGSAILQKGDEYCLSINR